MKTLLSSLSLLITSFLFAGTIKTKTYTPDSNAIFNVASTIIYGDKDAYLVDAQFQKQYAEELVKEIKKLKKDLKIIYISHSDPDYYFGLDVLKKNFPKAKIVSTAETAFLINASKDGKLKVWGPQLKNDIPSEIIIPEAIKSLPDLEGNKIEIEKTKNDPSHSYIWIPSIKTILGGISVSEEGHIWMADTQNIQAIDKWIEQINSMIALNPTTVIPSHFTERNFSPKVLDFTKNYLLTYKQAVSTYKTADEVIKYMKEKYPNLTGIDNLEFGTKVFMGEANWDSKSVYPAIEHTILFDFGQLKYNLTIQDDKNLINDNSSKKIKYIAQEIANNIFMVYWIDENTNENSIQVQNFNNNTVYSNTYTKDGKSTHVQGTFTIK